MAEVMFPKGFENANCCWLSVREMGNLAKAQVLANGGVGKAVGTKRLWSFVSRQGSSLLLCRRRNK